MVKIRGMEKHPLIDWMANHQPPLSQAAAAVKLKVSEPYLSLVLSGARGVSLKRALKWQAVTGLPIEAFLQREAAE
jgi:transcriptional regulator with XRE-family HTH domain